jgi:mercuric reductase
MNDKLDNALDRLNAILPLRENQERCDPQLKQLHQQLLRSFVDKGRILTRQEMAQWVTDVPKAVAELSKRDMVTFTANGEPVGAYPFTMDEREHKVQVNGHQLHTMCALDALAVAPMFDETVLIRSQCRVTGDPIMIRMSGETIQNPDDVRDVRFGIIWSAADERTCCADSLCMEMIFLRDAETAQKWLAKGTGEREVFYLPEAVEFASRFFVPRVA